MSNIADGLKTPWRPHTEELIIKKSRFIGHLFPANSVEEAESRLAEVRLAHKSATHNCYAYTVGLGVPVERFSDDGEPSGTAGRPMLEVIRKKGMVNTIVVVTRYFGGTLLGAGGLVHAYQDGTIDVIDKGEILTCIQMNRVQVRCDYSMFGKLEYEMGQLGHVLQDKVFESDVQFSLWIPLNETDSLVKKLLELTNGQAEVEVTPAEYVGVTPDGDFVPGIWEQ